MVLLRVTLYCVAALGPATAFAPVAPRRAAALGRPSTTAAWSAEPSSSYFSTPPLPAQVAAADADERVQALCARLRAAADEGETALAEAVERDFGNLDQAAMTALSARGFGDDAAAWAPVLAAVEGEVQARMERARTSLAELLATGELRALDARLAKMAKDGELTVQFMMVLNMNLASAAAEEAKAAEEGGGGGAAAEEGAEGAAPAASQSQVLRHVASRAQEELEKIQAVEFPARALLHRLCRTDVPAVRANLASHYLTPQREGIQLPDGRVLPPPEGTSGGLKPLVEPAEFATAMGVAVEQLRALDVDGQAVTEAIDDIRMVAKEARLALVQAHGGEEAPEVIEFQDMLTPVFQPGAAAAPPADASSS